MRLTRLVPAALLIATASSCARDDAAKPAAPLAPSFNVASATTLFAVDVSQDTTAQNETPVAVNPTNPDNIITGANDWNYNDGCAVNASFDGGHTWTSTLPNGFIPALTRFTNDPTVPGTGSFDAAGDPYVAFGPDGTAYFVCQSFNFASPFAIGLLVTRSTDGGRTWLDGVHDRPVLVSQWNGNGKSRGGNGQFPDHESMHVDNNPGSPYRGSVYITWAHFDGKGGHSPILIAYSRDGARTFSAPVKVSAGPIRNNQDARVVSGTDGTLYLTFDNGIQGGKGSANYISVSHDGGASWSTPIQVGLYNNPVCLFPPGCFNIPGGAFRGPGSYPAPALDAVRQRIDLVYSDINAAGRAEVYFQWAPVSDPTHWSAPVAIAPATGDRFGAELSVAPDGRLDVMFDDRSYTGNALVDVTYATSADGGATWSTSKVSTSPFDPSQYGVPAGAAVSPFLGDYNGIASRADRAVMTWTGVAPKTGVLNDNLEIWFGAATP